MRVLNSLKNMSSAMVQNISTILISFVARAIFIKTLGTEYLGLNSLFASIISMLAVAELGIASAIIFNMYKPIVENKKETIKSLMVFYQTCYRVIACTVLIIGLCIMPFLKLIIESNSIQENIYIIYILFLFEAVFSYLFSYKRSILYANQKNYIVNLMDLLYTIFMNTAQVIVLLFTGNYILYLIIKIASRLIENSIINLIVNRKYPYLKDKNVKRLEKNIVNDIIQKVKGLFLHKIGSFIVIGTDNIIISKFLGLTTLGLYTNYIMIANIISTLFSQIMTGTTASIGNLLTENSPNKTFDIYKKLNLLNFWLFSFATISIYCIMEPFITIWIGSDYLLSKSILLVICLNFYVQGMRKVFSLFKEAAGIFYEDRYVPLIESLINLIISLILVNILGLAGVLVGTIISSMILFVYSYPKYVYKPLFRKTIYIYFKEQVYYLVIMIIVFTCTIGVTKLFISNNNLLNLITNAIICIFVPNILFYIIFNRTQEFKYFKKLFLKLVQHKG
ncbi:lipopolysaccharide biosynthesis protein [Peribacillus frigoritolerans]|uniref:lipopolysaccharide biosynthesis protein n=1 Tax=Peribacillus frigoritolerans TaxID=450367 RepID=UPI0007BEFC65|nr:oligosaccharide flippase family protein [Peribacillus frigoritolerans]MED4694904.1 oligosaccharide flippase family protein [Peribacillus frigoritolerans]